MTVISRTSLIVADAIVLGVTWCATYRTTLMMRVSGQQSKHSYSGILLRDGTIRSYSVSVVLGTDRYCITLRNHVFPVGYATVTLFSIFTLAAPHLSVLLTLNFLHLLFTLLSVSRSTGAPSW